MMKQDLISVLASLRQALAYDYRIVAMPQAERPVFLAVSLPLTSEVTGIKPRLPSGRGLSLLQALVSAGAEAVELRASLAWSHADRIAALPRHDGLSIVEATDLCSGARVFVPAQTVFLDHSTATAEPLQTDARSTGCATGPDHQIATEHALMECIERDAIVFWWHGGVAAQSLALEMIDPLAPRLCWWLQNRARQTRLLGLRSDTGVPVVVAVSADPDGSRVAYGAAAEFDATAACLSAVTELVQTEVSFAAALSAGSVEAVTWQNYADVHRQPQFQPDKTGAPSSWAALDWPNLLDRMTALKVPALSVDLTLPEDPLPTVRVLVPGLCDMGGRIDTPRFRRHAGMTDPDQQPALHHPEPF